VIGGKRFQVVGAVLPMDLMGLRIKPFAFTEHGVLSSDLFKCLPVMFLNSFKQVLFFFLQPDRLNRMSDKCF